MKTIEYNQQQQQKLQLSNFPIWMYFTRKQMLVYVQFFIFALVTI